MELLILLFVAAVAMWMVPIVHRGRVIPIVMAMLVTGTVFGPFFFAIDGPIQFSLDRVLWVSIMVMVVVGWRLGEHQVSETWTNRLVVGRTDWLSC